MSMTESLFPYPLRKSMFPIFNREACFHRKAYFSLCRKSCSMFIMESLFFESLFLCLHRKACFCIRVEKPVAYLCRKAFSCLCLCGRSCSLVYVGSLIPCPCWKVCFHQSPDSQRNISILNFWFSQKSRHQTPVPHRNVGTEILIHAEIKAYKFFHVSFSNCSFLQFSNHRKVCLSPKGENCVFSISLSVLSLSFIPNNVLI